MKFQNLILMQLNILFFKLIIRNNCQTAWAVIFIQERKKRMEKVVLKDGTEIQIADGASGNCITVPFTEAEVSGIVANFTQDNLAEFKIYNASGVLCTTITNKKLKTYTTNLEEKTVTLNLEDVSELESRIAELEATQEMQDEAIAELAAMEAGEGM